MQTISVVWEDGASRDWVVPYWVALATVLRGLDWYLPGLGVPRAVSVSPWRED